MGFKTFLNKLVKGQDELKIPHTTSHDVGITDSQHADSADRRYPIPLRMHFITKGATATCKLTTELAAGTTLTASAPIETSQLCRQLWEAALFQLGGQDRPLSARRALQTIRARSSSFDSIPVAPILTKSSGPADAGRLLGSTENDGARLTVDVAVAEGSIPSESFTSACEQQRRRDWVATVNKRMVWPSEAACIILNKDRGSDALLLEQPPQSHTIPTLGLDVVAEHSERTPTTAETPSSVKASDFDGSFSTLTPFTSAEVPKFRETPQQFFDIVHSSEVERSNGAVSPKLSDSPRPTSPDCTTSSRRTSSCLAVEKNVQDYEHLAEPEQLQAHLSYQELLSKSLRLQLLEREDEVATLHKELQALQRERAMYEAEQDATAEQLQIMQKELMEKGSQLTEEKQRTAAAVHQLHLWRDSIQSGPEQLIAQRDQALQEARNQYRQAQNSCATANAAMTERENMVQYLAHMDAVATSNNKLHETEVMELRARLEHAAEALNGQQQQVNHLVSEKDAAEARVRELEVRVEYLVADVTTKWLEDPPWEQEQVNSYTVKPDELRDLRQAFEISQTRLAASADTNEELHSAANKREKELSELREKNELLADKAARLSSTFNIWKDKLDNWMQTIPGIVNMREDVNEIPGLKELLESSVYHEQRLAAELEGMAARISELEGANLKLRQSHRKEVEALEERASKLQEDTVRLDALNFEVSDKLDEEQRESGQLRQRLTETEEDLEAWRAQCETQAFGDSATVIREHHEQNLKTASDINSALHHQLARYHTAKEVAEQGLDDMKGWLTEELAGVSELGAQRDWYQAQVDALRQRFQHELLVEPLEIAYRPAFADLSSEERAAMIAAEDKVIGRVTTMAPLRSWAEPRDIEIPDLWAQLLRWVKEGDDVDAKARET
ncbi:translocon subunit [Exophiala dermatitidis]|nr:translocon subunit [Exophiala dermatitidis]KAJ4556631.1 translocon subunit [Exophiala dermatitidis]